jgi:hypothetical protein
LLSCVHAAPLGSVVRVQPTSNAKWRKPSAGGYQTSKLRSPQIKNQNVKCKIEEVVATTRQLRYFSI